MLRLVFVGDIMLSRGVASAVESEGVNIISDEIKDVLKHADLCIGNLECPISERANLVKKNGFKAKPSALKKIADFDVLSVANNHVFDCGISGAYETIKNLDKFGVRWVGVNDGRAKYIQPVRYEIKGKNISIFACVVEECRGYDKRESQMKLVGATDSCLHSSIRNERACADVVIALVHGGNEMIAYPQPTFRTLCKNIVDVGADIVVTTHPHVLGGYEKYRDGHIFYSLGDFVFDADSNIRRRGGILCLAIREDLRVDLLPIVIDQNVCVLLAKDKMSKKILKKYRKVSAALAGENYDRMYGFYYFMSFGAFQLDRLLYKIRRKGLKDVLLFLFSRRKYFAFYVNNVKHRRFL